jgi:S1-C subfamily serine protease
MGLASMVILASCGCMPQSTLLVNPDGKVARCPHGWGWGLPGAIGIGEAQEVRDQCVMDMERNGFVRLPNVNVGINPDYKADPPVIRDVKEPAKSAGINDSDLLLAVDGVKVQNAAQMARLLNAKKSGETLTIKVGRGAEKTEMVFRVVLQ